MKHTHLLAHTTIYIDKRCCVVEKQKKGNRKTAKRNHDDSSNKTASTSARSERERDKKTNWRWRPTIFIYIIIVRLIHFLFHVFKIDSCRCQCTRGRFQSIANYRTENTYLRILYTIMHIAHTHRKKWPK